MISLAEALLLAFLDGAARAVLLLVWIRQLGLALGGDGTATVLLGTAWLLAAALAPSFRGASRPLKVAAWAQLVVVVASFVLPSLLQPVQDLLAPRRPDAAARLLEAIVTFVLLGIPGAAMAVPGRMLARAARGLATDGDGLVSRLAGAEVSGLAAGVALLAGWLAPSQGLSGSAFLASVTYAVLGIWGLARDRTAGNVTSVTAPESGTDSVCGGAPGTSGRFLAGMATTVWVMAVGSWWGRFFGLSLDVVTVITLAGLGGRALGSLGAAAARCGTTAGGWMALGGLAGAGSLLAGSWLIGRAEAGVAALGGAQEAVLVVAALVTFLTISIPVGAWAAASRGPRSAEPGIERAGSGGCPVSRPGGETGRAEPLGMATGLALAGLVLVPAGGPVRAAETALGLGALAACLFAWPATRCDLGLILLAIAGLGTEVAGRVRDPGARDPGLRLASALSGETAPAVPPVLRAAAAPAPVRLEGLWAHLPLFMSPAPRRVLVLGPGTLSTLAAVRSHGVATVVEARPLDHDETPPGTDRRTDPRALRHILAAGGEPWDIVLAGGESPWAFGPVGVETAQYFAGIAGLLGEQGLLAHRVHHAALGREARDALLRTMLRAFGHMTVFAVGPDHWIVVASARPLATSSATLVARWSERPTAVADLAARGLTDPLQLLGHHLIAPEDLELLIQDAYGPTHSDDRPWLEWHAAPAARAALPGSRPRWEDDRLGPLPTLLEERLRDHPPDPDQLLSFAGYFDGEYPAPVIRGTLEAVIAARPGDRRALTQLARIDRAHGDLTAALEALEEASRPSSTRIDPLPASAGDPALLLEKFDVALSLEKRSRPLVRHPSLPRARAAAEALVAALPEEPLPYLCLGRALAEEESWTGAASAFSRGLDLARSREDRVAVVDLSHRLAICHLRLGDHASADRVLKATDELLVTIPDAEVIPHMDRWNEVRRELAHKVWKLNK